jgi:hypothetical protein
MQSESPDKPSLMRWLTKMPDGLSLLLLVGAIGSALAVHDRVQDLERDVRALQSDVTEIKRAVVGTFAER